MVCGVFPHQRLYIFKTWFYANCHLMPVLFQSIHIWRPCLGFPGGWRLAVHHVLSLEKLVAFLNYLTDSWSSWATFHRWLHYIWKWPARLSWFISDMVGNTVLCHYNMVNILQTIHKHPIRPPSGQNMNVYYEFKIDPYTLFIAKLYSILCYPTTQTWFYPVIGCF